MEKRNKKKMMVMKAKIVLNRQLLKINLPGLTKFSRQILLIYGGIYFFVYQGGKPVAFLKSTRKFPPGTFQDYYDGEERKARKGRRVTMNFIRKKAFSKDYFSLSEL